MSAERPARSSAVTIGLALLAGLFAGLWLGDRRQPPPEPAKLPSVSSSAAPSPTVARNPDGTTRKSTSTSTTVVPTARRLGSPIGPFVPTPRPVEGVPAWVDRSARMELVVAQADGTERRRLLDVYDVRHRDGEAKTLMTVLEPSDVAGFGYLALLHPDSPADVWIYIRELRRVRRIGDDARNTGFLGTDLTYADMILLDDLQAGGAVAESAEETGTMELDGVSVAVVELSGLGRGLPYARLVVWFGADDGIMRRVDFFDDGGALVRRFSQSDVRAIGDVRVAHHGEAVSFAPGSRTVIDLSDVRLDRGLSDELFTVSGLVTPKR